MGYAFISYSSKNQREADLINNFFKEHGISTWMAPYDIRPGGQWAGEISSGIKNCSCFVLVLTENSQKSTQVYREVDLAVNFEKPIIPIKLDKCKLNETFQYYLHSQHMVVVSKLNFSDPAFKKVFESVKYWTGIDINTKNDETSEVDDKISFEAAFNEDAQFLKQSNKQDKRELVKAPSALKEQILSKKTEPLFNTEQNDRVIKSEFSHATQLSSPTIIRLNIPENIVGSTIELDNGLDHLEQKAESAVNYVEVNSGGNWVIKVKEIENVKPENISISSGGQFNQVTLTLDDMMGDTDSETFNEQFLETINIDQKNKREIKENAVIKVKVPVSHIGETIVLKHNYEIIEKQVIGKVTDIAVSESGLWRIHLKQSPSLRAEAYVEIPKNIKVALEKFRASITARIPKELDGNKFVCENNDSFQVRQAYNSVVTFEIDQPDLWEIHVDDNPFIHTSVLVPEEGDYRLSLIIEPNIPKLIVKAPDLNGQILTCSEVNGNRILKQQVEKNEAEFLIPNLGKWTVSCDQFTEDFKTVEISQKKSYEIDYYPA